ncbi:unnamed protein product, partial [Ectocarpus sp. 13 AM-2016]
PCLFSSPGPFLSLSLSARCTRDISIVFCRVGAPKATRNGASNMSRRTCRRPRPAEPPPFGDEQEHNDHNSSAPLKRSPRRPRPPGDPPAPTVTTEISRGKEGAAGVVVALIPSIDDNERSAPEDTTDDGDKRGRGEVAGYPS